MTESVKSAEICILLRELHIYPKYRGYQYLAAAIRLVSQDESLLCSVTKTLYPMVAELYHTTWNCVEHDMRTAITVCWDQGGKSLLETISRRELLRRPTTVEFIDILANYLMRYSSSRETEHPFKT